MQEVTVPIEVKIEEIPELVGEKLLARVDAIAEETARQVSQITFRKMDQVIREAGMVTTVDCQRTSTEVCLNAYLNVPTGL